MLVFQGFSSPTSTQQKSTPNQKKSNILSISDLFFGGDPVVTYCSSQMPNAPGWSYGSGHVPENLGRVWEVSGMVVWIFHNSTGCVVGLGMLDAPNKLHLQKGFKVHRGSLLMKKMVLSSTSKRIVGRRTRRFFWTLFFWGVCSISPTPTRATKKRWLNLHPSEDVSPTKKCADFPARHVGLLEGMLFPWELATLFFRFLMTFPDPERFTGSPKLSEKKNGRPLKGPQIESLKLNPIVGFLRSLKTRWIRFSEGNQHITG